LFVHHSKHLIDRYVGVHASGILQFFMIAIAVLAMIFALLSAFGVSPQSLLTGAGIISVATGLIVSTFVGGILSGALVFTMHKLSTMHKKTTG